ncbi:MAG: 50S ribosomal protein L23 [Armatimonadota bacterium]
MSKAIHEVLIRPVLTEKSVGSTQPSKKTNQSRTKYTFEVAMDATKTDIATAVEKLFEKEKVKVASVNTMHVRGKQRRATTRRGRRPSVGMSAAWKKAVVTIAADSPTIPMLEGA